TPQRKRKTAMRTGKQEFLIFKTRRERWHSIISYELIPSWRSGFKISEIFCCTNYDNIYIMN
ncbi:hypothetical protein DRQ33_06700, partial [bacterium]